MEGCGRVTGQNLQDLSALYAPWTRMNGCRVPPFSRSAALLSLELSALSYEQVFEPWQEAGWHDMNCRIGLIEENKESDENLPARLLRLLLKPSQWKEPFLHLQESIHLKQRRTLDKQVVMAHPIENGRYLIAIGFMGSTRQLSDWAVNFKIDREEGAHQGFAEMARALEEMEDQILFPETARALGLPRLSLRDMIAECGQTGSRFTFWLSGHSQGAAVMQLYADRLLRRGFLRRYLVGYGFASPSVFYEGDEASYLPCPLYHILNGDDSVARMGAKTHVGMCRVMNPDEDMRNSCYGALWEDRLFRRVLSLVSRLRDNRDMLLFLSALLSALEELPDEESLAILSGVFARHLPDKLTSLLGGGIDELLRSLKQRLDRAAVSALGDRPFPPEREHIYALYLSRLIREYGARTFTAALGRALGVPHKLRTKAGYPGMAPYEYIVTKRFHDLRQSIFGGAAPLQYTDRPRKAAVRGKRTRFAAYSGQRLMNRSRKPK